jgi:hypothetical protein
MKSICQEPYGFKYTPFVQALTSKIDPCGTNYPGLSFLPTPKGLVPYMYLYNRSHLDQALSHAFQG